MNIRIRNLLDFIAVLLEYISKKFQKRWGGYSNMGKSTSKEANKELDRFLLNYSRYTVLGGRKILLSERNISKTPLSQISQLVLSQFPPSSLTLMLPLRNSLRVLKIVSGTFVIDDHGAITIAKYFRELRQLSLRGHNIQDNGAIKLIKNLRELDFFDLSDNRASLPCRLMIKRRTKNFEYSYF